MYVILSKASTQLSDNRFFIFWNISLFQFILELQRCRRAPMLPPCWKPKLWHFPAWVQIIHLQQNISFIATTNTSRSWNSLRQTFLSKEMHRLLRAVTSAWCKKETSIQVSATKWNSTLSVGNTICFHKHFCLCLTLRSQNTIRHVFSSMGGKFFFERPTVLFSQLDLANDTSTRLGKDLIDVVVSQYPYLFAHYVFLLRSTQNTCFDCQQSQPHVRRQCHFDMR